MKPPLIPGTEIKDLQAPTRRRFIQMGAAALMSRIPITAGAILDGTQAVQDKIHLIFSKILCGKPTQLDGSFRWMFDRYFHLDSFNDLIDPSLPALSGTTDEDLLKWMRRCYDIEKTDIQRKYSKILYQLPGDMIDGIVTTDSPIWFGEDVLSQGDATTIIKPSDLTGFTCEFLKNDGDSITQLSLFESFQQLTLRCDYWDEDGERYSHSIRGDEESIVDLLSQGFNQIAERVVVEHTQRIAQQESSNKKVQEMQKRSEDRQLPINIEFQEKIGFYDELVNGRIKITDEVKQRVREVFG